MQPTIQSFAQAVDPLSHIIRGTIAFSDMQLAVLSEIWSCDSIRRRVLTASGAD